MKRNADIKPLEPKKPCQFGADWGKYKRTCDIERGVKVYDYAANKQNEAQLIPKVESTKRHWPGYSQSKGKQFCLWDVETKKGRSIPGPAEYDQSDKATKPSRFDGVGFGVDLKCTA